MTLCEILLEGLGTLTTPGKRRARQTTQRRPDTRGTLIRGCYVYLHISSYDTVFKEMDLDWNVDIEITKCGYMEWLDWSLDWNVNWIGMWI